MESLKSELARLSHPERMRRVLEAGRGVKAGGDAARGLDELRGGGAFERWMAVKSCYTSRDGALILASVQDPSQLVRGAARKLVALACDDAQSFEALRLMFATRQHHRMLSSLRKRGRTAPIDAFLDWLREQPGETLFADVVPYGSPQAISRHLGKALERAGFNFWDRMVRHAPGALAALLTAQLSAADGHPDSRQRWLIERALPAAADRAPDEALPLWLLLRRRGVPIAPKIEPLLVKRRPRAMCDVTLGERILPSGGFAAVAHELGKERLLRLIGAHANLLGEPGPLLARLPPGEREEVAVAWAGALAAPRLGAQLLGYLGNHPELREKTHVAWSYAARNQDGVIGFASVEALPVDLAGREARRHLFEVTQLATRPGLRLQYAELLPWEEAAAALRDHMGHPEGDVRGPAVATLLRAAGRQRRPELIVEALGMVKARKNEQDPVRERMLQALLAWPREVWLREHLPSVGQIVRDGLDAADLSYSSAKLLEDLVLRVFRLDGAWGAVWLATLARERGRIHTGRLGDLLSDDEVRAAAGPLLELARAWAERERDGHLLALCSSLGARLGLVPGLLDLLESIGGQSPDATTLWIMGLFASHDRPRYERLLPGLLRRWLADTRKHGNILAMISQDERLDDTLAGALVQIAEQASHIHTAENALSLLCARRKDLFFQKGPELLARDPSYILAPSLLWLVHRRRQDLLTPYLRGDRVRGRFATGNTAWVLPITSGFERWSPEQHALFAEALGRVCADRERDTPTIGQMIYRLQDLCFSEGRQLIALADDDRAAIQEMAVRALSRLDAGQGIPKLLACMEDARARIAIYALRRAVLKMPPVAAVGLLKQIPLRKVTVAKEVTRLLGEMRTEEAYQAILEIARGKPHRDVQIALLRALWDHLERDETWGILEAAALGEDWIMASRVGDIPPDRLSDRSERRLSALLARVLDRPEPEARIDLLRRAHALPIRDHERHFYRRCLARMESRYDDEIDAAVAAAVARATERDVDALVEQIRECSLHRKVLQRVMMGLSSGAYRQSSVARAAARGALAMMAEDALLVDLHARVAARVFPVDELLSDLDRVAARGWFDEFPFAAQAPLGELSPGDLERFEQQAGSRPHFALRLAALQALVQLSSSKGWTPELRERLAAYQRDPSPRVAVTAQFIFPPLEEPKAPGPLTAAAGRAR